MFVIKPIADRNILSGLFNNSSLSFDESSHGVSAVEDGKDAGYCLFSVNDYTVSILYLSYPEKDYEMGDTLLRAAINYAANRNAYIAECSVSEYSLLLKALGFVENGSVYKVEIPEIFTQCKNCRKS